MDLSYGIAVNNRYGLFYDENEDPMDALKAASQPKEAVTKVTKPDAKQAVKPAEVKGKAGTTQPAGVKKTATGPKEAPAASQNKSVVDGQNKREGSGLGPRPPRVDRGGRTAPASAGPQEERNNRRNNDRQREFGSVGNTEVGTFGTGNGTDGDYRPRTAFRGDRGERGSYRGAGGERGARGGRGAGGRGRGGYGQDTRGKRDFDRQSGSDKSGVKPVEKRDGSGPHNWGSVQDEIEGQLEPAVEETAETEGAPVDSTEAKEGEGETAPAVPEEEEPKELTLDEYRALRGERKKPEFNIRKPGEGEDNSQWKKTFVLDKKKPLEEDEEEEIIDLTAEYPQRAGRQKRLDIDIRFADSRRGGGGFERGGGRGRGRGGGDRPFRGEGDRGGFRGDGEQRGGHRGGERGEGEQQRRPYNRDRGDGEQREGGYRGGYRGDRGGDRGNDRGGYRGGRGGERRGGFGGAARGPPAPKVDDEKDFPALG